MAKFIIAQALVEIKTQTKDQVIHFLAFLTWSSSHPEIKYIIQASINDITAKTAVYFIQEEIRFHKNQKNDFSQTVSEHQGSQSQTTQGALDSACV